MADTVKVVATVVGKQSVTLYHPDGTTTVLNQGDTRLPAIIEKVIPAQAKGEIAEVEIPVPDKSTYANFEKKTNGMVKFFRVAKKFVSHVFDTDSRMDPEEVKLHEEAVKKVNDLRLEGAAPEVIKAAEILAKPPVAKKKVWEGQLGAGIVPGIPDAELKTASAPEADETVIAVVNGTVIPNMEALRSQFAHIVQYGGEQGMIRFLERLANVIDQRGHSVEDILRFMERGDLPLAEDGTIIAYKLLNTVKANSRRHNDAYSDIPGIMFDVHSGQIPQRIGTEVRVDESLVDRNRRNECSNGLHIARRGYLGSFSGDVCVLAKIFPEDIIAVPHNDANKVRVCAYHILFVLTREEFVKVKADKSMTDAEDSQTLLGKAIRGDHVPILERVEVHGQRGSNLRIVALAPKADVDAEYNRAVARKSASTDFKAISVAYTEKHENGIMINEASKLDPKKVSQDVKAATTPVAPAEPVKEKAPEPAPVSNPAIDAAFSRGTVKPAPEPAKQAPVSTGSARTKQAAEFYARMTDKDNTDADRRAAALALKGLKTKAKVSYLSLGLQGATGDEIQEILDIVPADVPTPAAKPEPRFVAQGKALAKAAAKPAPSKKETKTKAPQGTKVVTLKGKPIGVAQAAPKKPANLKGSEVVSAKVKPTTKSEAKPKTPVKSAPTKPEAKPQKATASESRDVKARRLWNTANDKKLAETVRKSAAQELKDFKKKSKVSWDKLGLDKAMTESFLTKTLGK